MASMSQYIKVAKLKVARMREYGHEKMDQLHDQTTIQISARWLDRWKDEICMVDSYEEIDYSEPHVAIELLFCDPVNVDLVRSKKMADKQRVYSLMTEEMLDIYFNEVDENGTRYCDLETRSMVKLIRGNKKKK